VKIGLTYDLRDEYRALGFTEEETAEFDRAETIAALEETLQAAGYETERIGHLRSLLGRLHAGERWDLVFNIAEGLHGFGREAQIPAILDAFALPYTFSDPLVLSLTLHKGLTKRVIRDLDLPTPDFAVVTAPDELDAVRLPLPLFVKPVAEGTSKGITAASLAATREELVASCSRLLADFRQPVLVETYLPGREFTDGILGTGRDAEAVGVMEVHLRPCAEGQVYSYRNKEECEERVDYALVRDDAAQEARRIALAAWRGLGCRDAGRVDLRADAAGKPHFLEVNPLAGLHPEHSDLPILCGLAGMGYAELIGRIMRSALGRLAKAPCG
jgi:D-alanine-D-alanine ligase